jgi:integrase
MPVHLKPPPASDVQHQYHLKVSRAGLHVRNQLFECVPAVDLQAAFAFIRIAPDNLHAALGGIIPDRIRLIFGRVFPDLGVRPIADITTLELLDTVRKVERRGAIELAHRLLETCGQIFRYAVITGRVKYNITADLKGVLKTRKVEHHAYLKAHELPDFLRAVDGYQGDILTKLALKLMLLTFVRTGELINAQWSEFNMAKAQWIIPAERMKMGEQHIVPLSRQAIGILAELRRHTGTRSHLFPGRNNPHKAMSNNTLLFASYRMGYHGRMTIHGLRATASTILNEMHFPADVIERQLAHGERNEIRRAYNHAQYLPQRTDMMQRWADYLDELTERGNVINISVALHGSSTLVCLVCCGCVNSITQAEPKLSDAISLPKHGTQSICAEMPCPGRYSLMMAWSGSALNKPSWCKRVASGVNQSGSGPR